MQADDLKPIIFFDGVCNLCNRSVQFVIKHDKQAKFMFASLQSNAGQELLKQHQLPQTDFNSFILYDNGKIYTRSAAALRVAKELQGWKWLAAFRIIPRFLRDAVYDLIARNRYRWFGKKDECMIPTPDLKARFLE